jgi:glutamine cyclotransferase
MPITVNFNKAVDITKERLRVERKPKLEALDVEMMRNLSDQEKLAEIEAQKQVLRDVTKLADQATTLEELKSLKVE